MSFNGRLRFINLHYRDCLSATRPDYQLNWFIFTPGGVAPRVADLDPVLEKTLI